MPSSPHESKVEEEKKEEENNKRVIHAFDLSLDSVLPLSSRYCPDDLKLWKSSRIFFIDNFLSPNECRKFIDASNKIREGEGFESLESEYPASYRNSARLLVESSSLAASLYQRLVDQFRPADIANVRPYGFANAGTWKPQKLNSVFKVSRYNKNSFFKPHMDGSFVEDDNIRSIFTLLVYLNDDYSGGETEFYCKENNEVKYTYKGKLGSAVVFNHDLHHSGLPVIEGQKLIVKTEVMFRTDQEFSYENDAAYIETTRLMDESAKLESEGKVEEATKVYIEAINIQSKYPSVPKENIVTIEEDGTVPLHPHIFLLIFRRLQVKEVVSLGTVSKRWNKLSKNEIYWKEMYNSRFPFVFPDIQRVISSGIGKAFLLDWANIFKGSFQAHSHPVITLQFEFNQLRCQKGMHPSADVKNMFISELTRPSYVSHYSLPGQGLITKYIYCDEVPSAQESKAKRIIDPMGNMIDWRSFSAAWKWMCARKLKGKGEKSPILLVENEAWGEKERAEIRDIAFDTIGIPMLHTVPYAVLVMYSCGRELGIVLDFTREEVVISSVRGDKVIEKRKIKGEIEEVMPIVQEMKGGIQQHGVSPVPLVFYNSNSGRGSFFAPFQFANVLLKKLKIESEYECIETPPAAAVKGGAIYASVNGLVKFTQRGHYLAQKWADEAAVKAQQLAQIAELEKNFINLNGQSLWSEDSQPAIWVALPPVLLRRDEIEDLKTSIFGLFIILFLELSRLTRSQLTNYVCLHK